MSMRKLTPLIVGLTAVALVAGCGSSGTADAKGSGDAAAAGQTLTIGMPNGSQTNNSNPFMNTSSAQSLGYAWMIYEPLAQVNAVRPADDPTPWLASEWTWNEDFTALTLTVRDGVTWQDGKDLTADDVAFSFSIRKDNPALNADALPYGEITTADNTVTVAFTASQFVNQTKVLNLFVVPKHIWSAIADPTTDLNQEPVGTGPYTLKTWTPQAATLTPNDAYWGGKPPVPELRYTSYNDNNALTTALVNGDAQWGWTFIPDFENVYVAKDPDHNAYWYPAGLGIDVLYLNNETAPFDNVAVRQAVNLVIDREQIHTQATSSVFPQLENPTGIPEPAGTEFISAEYAGETLTPDVDAAKKILADAGYTLDGETLTDPSGEPVTFSLVDPAGWSDYLTGLQIVADAVKPLGITATVETMNADAWFAAIANGEFQASMHWTNSGSTPWDMYSNMMDGAQYVPLGEKANWNFGRFSDEGATQALADFATSADPAVRADAMDRVQKVFVEQVPAIAMVGRPIAAEFSTKYWTGWPSEDDPYATPQATMPAASQIVMNLKPATD